MKAREKILKDFVAEKKRNKENVAKENKKYSMEAKEGIVRGLVEGDKC